MKSTLKMQALVFIVACTAIFHSCKKDPGIPIVTTTDITGITATTAATGGLVTSDGGSDVRARGVCWSTFSHPTIDNTKTADGAGTGSFSSIMSGLAENTTYYVRAYATNRVGTGYGNEITFTTINIVVPASLPTIKTTMITSIGPVSAVSGGTITSDGGDSISSRGVCWGTKADPTINNFRTVDGSGKGSFNSNINGLSPGTTYFARAYASNSAGTAYGTQLSFTTPVDENSTGPQRANFPGGPRYGAAGFAIGTKVYIGLGFIDVDGQSAARDFWEWDQATNTWMRSTDFQGGGRTAAVGLSIGNKGYIGTGSSVYAATIDFWEYNP